MLQDANDAYYELTGDEETYYDEDGDEISIYGFLYEYLDVVVDYDFDYDEDADNFYYELMNISVDCNCIIDTYDCFVEYYGKDFISMFGNNTVENDASDGEFSQCNGKNFLYVYNKAKKITDSCTDTCNKMSDELTNEENFALLKNTAKVIKNNVMSRGKEFYQAFGGSCDDGIIMDYLNNMNGSFLSNVGEFSDAQKRSINNRCFFCGEMFSSNFIDEFTAKQDYDIDYYNSNKENAFLNYDNDAKNLFNYTHKIIQSYKDSYEEECDEEYEECDGDEISIFYYCEDVYLEKIMKIMQQYPLDAGKDGNSEFVDEYIVKMFSNFTTKDNAKNLLEQTLPNSTARNAQVEYIITGETDTKRAMQIIFNRIWALKFYYRMTSLLNWSYYDDYLSNVQGYKHNYVKNYKTLIWAYCEAYEEAKAIMNGKSSVVNNHFRLESNMTYVTHYDEEDPDTQSYRDNVQEYSDMLSYLLSTMNRSTKMQRVVELIEMNMQDITGNPYDLFDYYAYVRADVEVKSNYIFLSSVNLVGFEEENKKGGKKISIKRMRGY